MKPKDNCTLREIELKPDKRKHLTDLGLKSCFVLWCYSKPPMLLPVLRPHPPAHTTTCRHEEEEEDDVTMKPVLVL